MKNIILFLFITFFANSIFANNDLGVPGQMEHIQISKNSSIAESKCPNSSDGCLIKDDSGNLTIYLKDIPSLEMEQIAILGLRFDAFQYENTGKVNKLKLVECSLHLHKKMVIEMLQISLKRNVSVKSTSVSSALVEC